MAEEGRRHEAPIPNEYKRDGSVTRGLDIPSEEETREDNPLVEAFRVALKQAALTDEAWFVKFTAQGSASDSMLLHGFLSFGLEALAQRDPAAVISYLVGDSRRFTLGSYSNLFGRTRALISAIALSPAIGKEQMATLERAILNFNHYPILSGDDAKTRQDKTRWNRKHRLILLGTLPVDALSESTQKLLAEEARAFPNAGDGIMRVRGGFVGGPMSKEQMAKAPERDIVRLLNDIPDSAGWGDDRWIFDDRGGEIKSRGSIQTSRALAEVAKENPQKALSIVAHLDPATHARPATYVLDAITKEKVGNEEYFNLIRQHAAKGYNSLDFFEGISRNLQSRIASPVGLPDDICQMLWTAFEGISTFARDDAGVSQEKPDREHQSILWGMHGAQALPGDGFSVLETAILGLLFKKPIPRGRVVALLQDALAKNLPLSWWRALMHQVLIRMHLVQPTRAAVFLEALFLKYPALLGSVEGAMLLAYAVQWATSEDFFRWLGQVRHSGWERADQAYGELLGLYVILHPSDSTAQQLLSEHLKAIPNGASNHGEKDVFVGLALATANLWSDHNLRSKATELFEALSRFRDPQVATALLDLFRLVHLEPDDYTKRVLATIISEQLVVTAKRHGFLVDRLLDVLPECADLISVLAKQMVSVFGEDLANISTARAADTPSMISIALTLQRQPEPYRTAGLELFEALVKLEAFQVRDALAEIDRRPHANPVSNRRLRRSRRRITSVRSA